MNRILLLCLLLAVTSASAQKSPAKFGMIPLEDMQMISYDQDSLVESVYLLDYGEARIENRLGRYVMVYKKHVRRKFLKSSAKFWSGDVSIPLFGGGWAQQTVSDFKASTYNLEDGRIVETPVERENKFREKANASITFQKFTMPNIKAGSIIEYTYVVTSNFLSSFPDWEFQHDEPVRKSEFYTAIPDNVSYVKNMQGYLPVFYESKFVGETEIQHWKAENVPPFRKEPFMNAPSDYNSKVRFVLSGIRLLNRPYMQITGSWNSLARTLLESENFGKRISKSGFLQETVAEVTAGIADPRERVNALHRYVRETIHWNGIRDFQARELQRVIAEKRGSSGDVNLLLGALLANAGFDVEMLLLSTRDHGFIRRNYPSPTQFNYVVCLLVLDGKNVILDATEKFLPPETLPQRCLNGEGLVVSPRRAGWIEIETKVKARTSVNAELKLDEYANLTGTVTHLFDGYDGLNARKDYAERGEEEYLRHFLTGRFWTVEKKEFRDLDVLEKPFRQILTVEMSDHNTQAATTLYVNPFVSERHAENPFKSADRLYPVDFGRPQEQIYICKFSLPTGFVVDERPADKVLLLPANAGRFSYSMTQLGTSVIVTRVLLINKSLFLQDEYGALREFFDQVVAKESEQIVLKKK